MCCLNSTRTEKSKSLCVWYLQCSVFQFAQDVLWCWQAWREEIYPKVRSRDGLAGVFCSKDLRQPLPSLFKTMHMHQEDMKPIQRNTNTSFHVSIVNCFTPFVYIFQLSLVSILHILSCTSKTITQWGWLREWHGWHIEHRGPSNWWWLWFWILDTELFSFTAHHLFINSKSSNRMSVISSIHPSFKFALHLQNLCLGSPQYWRVGGVNAVKRNDIILGIIIIIYVANRPVKFLLNAVVMVLESVPAVCPS